MKRYTIDEAMAAASRKLGEISDAEERMYRRHRWTYYLGWCLGTGVCLLAGVTVMLAWAALLKTLWGVVFG